MCHAFVGERTAAAAEYHANDFEWEDLQAEVEGLHATSKVCSDGAAFLLSA